MLKKIILFLFCLGSGMSAGDAQCTIWGEPVAVGNGVAQTYVELNDSGNPTQLGVALSEEALSNLPAHDMIQYDLRLPTGVNVNPFQFVTLNWNPMGHEPDGVYNTPHFDFHFYLISSSIQKGITCMGADEAKCMKPVIPEYLPSDYAPTPAGVPGMGWHWIDLLSGEWHGQPFTSTFIYGYYDGLMNFLEPMITREFLLSKVGFEAPLRLPAQFPYEGLYPDAYSIEHCPTEKLYRISLNNLSFH